MTATFAAMYFMGLTLNFVSITGLALAVGLLVDSSIVVLESIVGKAGGGQVIVQISKRGNQRSHRSPVGLNSDYPGGVFCPSCLSAG